MGKTLSMSIYNKTNHAPPSLQNVTKDNQSYTVSVQLSINFHLIFDTCIIEGGGE